ncbi:MAG: hypothetical protein H6710_08240 [Myxococcales bacterium]|nr:hypothetical protein [Myxococcales bacterium]
MSARASAASQLVVVAVVAGLAQIIAGVELGFALPTPLAKAIAEPATPYILAISGVMAAGLAAWLVRARVGVAVAVAVGGAALAWTLAVPHVTPLGLAYHGEFILHHFLTLVSAAVCLLVAHGWANDPELGRVRAAPLLAAALGVLLLVGQHIAGLPILGFDLEVLRVVGALAVFAAIVAGLALLWRRLDGWSGRALAVLLLAPLAVRLALGGALGLRGGQLGVSAAGPMTVAQLIAGVAAFVLIRPRLDRLGQVLALAVGASVSLALEGIYESRRFAVSFTNFEDLLRSIVGFEVPFPGFVERWRLGFSAVAIFAVAAAIARATLDPFERRRGLALALMVVAGLGLATPQLFWMQAAGALALIAALAEAAPAPVERVEAAPPDEPELILHGLAERREVEPPVVVEEATETVIALRGELRRVAFDLRARSNDGRRWRVGLRAGVLGRGAPEAEVIPDGEGEGHRLRGDARLVGEAGGGVLAALSAFPESCGRFWSAGAEVELGEDLARLGPASLEALVRALCRQVGAQG